MIDAEALVTMWLADRLPGTRVVAELPAGFENHLPVVQITALPGERRAKPWNGRYPLLWSPRIDLDAYARTRQDAYDLADRVSVEMHELVGTGNQWGHVTVVEETAGPSWRPDFNQAVRRAGLTIALTVRAS